MYVASDESYYFYLYDARLYPSAPLLFLPSSSHPRIPRHARSYSNDFSLTSHSGFKFGTSSKGAGMLTDMPGLNTDTDGQLRAVAGAGAAYPAGILAKFEEGEIDG